MFGWMPDTVNDENVTQWQWLVARPTGGFLKSFDRSRRTVLFSRHQFTLKHTEHMLNRIHTLFLFSFSLTNPEWKIRISPDFIKSCKTESNKSLKVLPMRKPLLTEYHTFSSFKTIFEFSPDLNHISLTSSALFFFPDRCEPCGSCCEGGKQKEMDKNMDVSIYYYWSNYITKLQNQKEKKFWTQLSKKLPGYEQFSS